MAMIYGLLKILLNKNYSLLLENMQLSKIVISILLLLTYSFGFAHNLVPHCNDSGEENHNHAPSHNHHFHSEGEAIDSEHADIAHDDHFDEGINDFITCLVNESEISVDDCSIEHCFTVNFNDFSFKDFSKIQTAILFSTVLDLSVAYKLDSNYFEVVEEVLFTPLIENSPHRGPPIFFC